MYADNVIQAMVKCLKSEHRALKKVPVPIFCCVGICMYVCVSLFNLNLVILQDAAWALSNIATGSIEVKRMIYSSEAMPLLLRFLTAAPLDLRKEVAHVIGHLCVVPSEGSGRRPDLIVDHLVPLVRQGCLAGFVDMVRSADPEAATLGIQLMELVSNTIILI